MADYDASTVLLVVDVQNDFADPGGSLYVRGGELVVPCINAEIARAPEAGALVLYTQDWHPPATPHFARDGGIWPVHCVAETWGAAFHPDLRVAGESIRKGTGGEDGYSAFTVRDPVSGDPSATRLGALLRERGIRRLVIAGLATDYCVKDTALDARALGFETTVLRATVRAVELRRGDASRAFAAMRRVGVTVE